MVVGVFSIFIIWLSVHLGAALDGSALFVFVFHSQYGQEVQLYSLAISATGNCFRHPTAVHVFMCGSVSGMCIGVCAESREEESFCCTVSPGGGRRVGRCLRFLFRNPSSSFKSSQP